MRRPRDGCERTLQALGAELDLLVVDGERDAHPPGAARAEALARRDDDAVLGEQRFGRQPVGQLEPDVERSLADGRFRERGRDRVAPALVRVDALGDRVLRARERGDRRRLQRREDADAAVIVEQVDPLDDLGVADDEADAPARHPVGLRHRPHLDADVLRAGRREEALRAPAVEDDVDVRGVVDDGAARSTRPGDGVLEDAVGHADGARIRGVVEVERRRGRRGGEVGRPAPSGSSGTVSSCAPASAGPDG